MHIQTRKNRSSRLELLGTALGYHNEREDGEGIYHDVQLKEEKRKKKGQEWEI